MMPLSRPTRLMHRRMNLHSPKIRAVFVALLLVVGSGVADEHDHKLIVKSQLSLEQVVDQQLNLSQFVNQIATYNNIASVSAVLPVGTTLVIPQPYLDKVQHGRVAYVKGDVVHKQTDLVVNPPAKGAQVYKGDIFQTGPDGFVSLTFKSGARVHVQPESRIVINDIDCVTEQSDCVISLQATDGQVDSEVTPRSRDLPPVQFSIETPFLSAAVRGTAFYVDLEESSNRIGVTRGLVATEGGGQSNELPEGKGLTVSEGSTPELVDLLQPPELSLKGQRLLLSEEDSIGWKSLSGARLYRADIAADEDMSERVASLTTGELAVLTPELAPGDYYLTVAAIDAGDFLGLPVKQKVAIAEITDDAKPVLEVSRQDGVTQLSAPEYNGRLELLISNSVNSHEATSLILENGSETRSLTLDETQEWVFRARKLIDPYKVSPYSEYYVFQAREP